MQKNTIVTIGLLVVAAVLIGVLSWYKPVEAPTDGTATTTPNGTATTTDAGTATSTVSFRVLSNGTLATNSERRRNIAVYSQAELRNLWSRTHGVEGAPPVPTIDFSKEYVIGVFAGEKNTGGHTIAVTSISEENDTRTLTVTLTTPGQGCITTQAVTSPFEIIVVPLSDARLANRDVTVTTTCP